MLRLLAVCAGISAALSAQSPGVYALTNVKIHPVNGTPIESGTIIVRDGLIEAVGANVQPPSDAWIIDGKGTDGKTNLQVYPGLIDALTTAGMPTENQPPSRGARPAFGAPSTTPGQPMQRISGPEDRPATTSWVKASDAVNPKDGRLTALREAGFTTAAVFPMRGVIAGQGALLNLAGEKPGDMVIASPVGQMYTTQSGSFAMFPGSLMGVIAYIRQIHVDAAYYAEAKRRYEKTPQGNKRPAYDKALEGVLETSVALLPGVERRELERMIALSQELGVKPVLYGAHDAYLTAETLAKAKVPVLINLSWPDSAKDPDPMAHQDFVQLKRRKLAPTSPAALEKQGVLYAFYTQGLDRTADAMKSVRKAIDNGLSKEAALKALTMNPAKIFGVDNRLGSIEKGKIANLLVANGDLFDEKTKVQFVMVDGKKFEPNAEAPAAPAKPASARGGRR
jgi:imidazolonepropionase-like amidohydrolase